MWPITRARARRRGWRRVAGWAVLIALPLGIYLVLLNLVSWRMRKFDIDTMENFDGTLGLCSADGSRILNWPGRKDAAFAVWDTTRRVPLRKLAPPATKLKYNAATAATLLPSGRQYAMAVGREIRFCDIWTGRVQRRLRASWLGPNDLKHALPDPGQYRQIRFTPDGRLMAAIAYDDDGEKPLYVLVWDVPAGGVLGTLPLPVLRREVPGATIPARRLARALRRRFPQGLKVPARNVTEHAECAAVAFSPDGALLTVGAGHVYGEAGIGSVQLYDARAWQPLRAWSMGCAVRGMLFAPDSKRVLTVGAAGEMAYVALWDAATAGQVYVLSGDGADPNPPGAVAFSADGALLATTGMMGGTAVVEIRDAATGKLRREMQWPGRSIDSVAFRPDGNHFVALSNGDAVAEWRVR